jgi:alginate O-acetyltransferase complex protein AlgJ
MDATHVIGPAAELAAARAGGPTDPALDARLRRGIIDTQVSRPIAAALTTAFLLFIYAIPVSQAILERADDDESSLLALFERAPTAQNLRQFEHDLEQASFAKSFVQPRLQLLLSRFGRVGNKRALIGHDGWLYYTPGLLHLAGPSFVDPEAIQLREREAQQIDDRAIVHADPRPAIFAFRDMLARRGITLVLFPVPDKTMLQPMQLHGRVHGAEPVAVARNPGWNRFARDLSRRRVALFDPAPRLLAPGQSPLFLAQDTHWTPAWMQRAARDLASFVTRVASLPPARAPRALRAVTQSSERVGDLVDMLKLPDDQTLFRPQRVPIERVQDETGAPWEPDAAADVLLLGDSFTNVFSMDTMGWGEAAGLAPHLELALGRPVDVIALNDSGAFATRQALFRELSSGEDRLAGKRVVIWEFAARELSVGDWKPIAWQTAARRGARAW